MTEDAALGVFMFIDLPVIWVKLFCIPENFGIDK